RRDMLHRFARLVRGEPDEGTAVATLEVARAHTLVINGVCEAATIRPIPADQVEIVERDGHVIHALPGIESAFERCAADARMLHESGQFAFTQPPGRRDLHGYRHFAGPKAG